jgi:hypothetical protein
VTRNGLLDVMARRDERVVFQVGVRLPRRTSAPGPTFIITLLSFFIFVVGRDRVP